MKVLQINSVCGYGSTGRIAYDLAKVLESNGHECFIAYGRGTAPNDVKTIKIGSDFHVKTHGAVSRLTDKHGFYSKSETKKLIDEIKKYDPDIIHLHNIHGYYINIELLFNYLSESNKKVVWTLHDCWAFTGHCSHFDYVGCDKWKTGCFHCPQKNRYPKSLLLDNSKWNYQKKKELFTSVKDMTIVTPSEWLAGLVRKSFLNQYPVKVINNGIDLDVFKPTQGDFRKKYNLEDKFIILGVASVWEERKGLNDFIKLSKLLDDKYKIVLVGLSKNQIKSLPKNILGIERTSNATELAGIYTEADVFVNPTYEDNFPTTNLESIACGTPVITYNTGGSVESVSEGCGDVVDKGSVEALIKSINNVKDYYKDVWKDISKYSKSERFNDYVKIYKEL